MRLDHKIILASIVFGGLFWLVDSLLDYYIYYEGTGAFIDLLFSEVPAHETYVRSVVLIMFLLFGIVLSRMVNRVHAISDGLDERVKELNCLYEISDIIGKNYPLQETIEKIANSIYSTWHYMDLTGVRIVLDGTHVHSHDFREENLRLSRKIIVNGLQAGFIELYYSGEMSYSGEKTIPDEDERVLETIAENIGQFIVRKKAEQEQMESTMKLRALVNTIPDLVALKDPNGVYIKCNPKCERFLGAKKEDIIGKTDYDFLDKELADSLREKEKDVIDIGGLLVEEREITFADNGERQIVEIIRGPIYSPDGSLMGLLFIGRDVTMRKETELGLFRDKELAEESSENKGRFLAHMSHELRSPLNSIIGYSDILIDEEHGDLNANQSRFVLNVRKSGEHLLELINNILDNSKIESGQMEFDPEILYPQEVIDEVLTLIEPMAQTKSIELTSKTDLDNVEINADRMKMKQILYNLLSNAVKFTPKNGKIDLSSSLVDGNIQVSISDTGIGIPVDKQQVIFEPYRQASSSSRSKYKGTGLGLAIVKQFIEMHDGEIRVESEEGKGSTFVFTIPVKM